MGNLTLQGATSGQITLEPTAVAGTNTITLPAATGTLLTTAGGQTISGTVTLSTLTSPAATSLTIQSAGTTAMTINTSQNVGIGTSSPSGKLSVTGSGGTVSVGSAGDALIFSKGGTNYITTSTAGGQFQFQTGAGSNAMLIDSSGNVGIGTTTPSTKLHVVGEVTATQGVGGYPAFHATAGGAQTVSNGVNTKITLTEDFDTNTDFSSSRFTPSVAGYYQINGAVWSTAGTSMTYAGALIYKNGSSYSLSYGAAYTTTAANGIVSDIVYLNGSTDYVELYGRANGSGTLTITNNTFFSGCLIRGA